MPAAVAAGLPETTTPWLPLATLGPRGLTGVLVACGQAKGASKRRETDDIEMILRIRGLRCSASIPCPARHQGYINSLVLCCVPRCLPLCHCWRLTPDEPAFYPDYVLNPAFSGRLCCCMDAPRCG